MLTRGKLSKQTGCNAETIRYYERVGLLPEPPRSPSGYRLYDDEHVKRVHFIQRAKQLGFSADRLKDLLDLAGDSSHHTRADVKLLTRRHIDDISKKIRDLQKLKRELNDLSSRCDGTDESALDCPILISLFENE